MVPVFAKLFFSAAVHSAASIVTILTRLVYQMERNEAPKNYSTISLGAVIFFGTVG